MGDFRMTIALKSGREAAALKFYPSANTYKLSLLGAPQAHM